MSYYGWYILHALHVVAADALLLAMVGLTFLLVCVLSFRESRGNPRRRCPHDRVSRRPGTARSKR